MYDRGDRMVKKNSSSKFTLHWSQSALLTIREEKWKNTTMRMRLACIDIRQQGWCLFFVNCLCWMTLVYPPSPLSCTNCDRQTRGLRVDGKYIDYCLEQIEEEGYCGFLRKRAQTRLRHLQHPRLLHNGISIDGHKRCLPSEIQPESPEPTVVWDQWARFYRFWPEWPITSPCLGGCWGNALAGLFVTVIFEMLDHPS